MNEPGKKGQMQSGPSFENALRSCLLSGVIVVDGQRNLATLSPEAFQILALSPDQGSDLTIETLPPEIAAVAREALVSGKPSATRHIQLQHGESSGFIHLSAVPLKPVAGTLSVLLTLQALNPTSQFQHQIRQLDRPANAGTLAAGMAHEIKNALVAGLYVP